MRFGAVVEEQIYQWKFGRGAGCMRAYATQAATATITMRRTNSHLLLMGSLLLGPCPQDRVRGRRRQGPLGAARRATQARPSQGKEKARDSAGLSRHGNGVTLLFRSCCTTSSTCGTRRTCCSIGPCSTRSPSSSASFLAGDLAREALAAFCGCKRMEEALVSQPVFLPILEVLIV